MWRTTRLTASALTIGLALGAIGSQFAGAQQPPLKRTDLLKLDLGEIKDSEMNVWVADIAAGRSNRPALSSNTEIRLRHRGCRRRGTGRQTPADVQDRSGFRRDAERDSQFQKRERDRAGQGLGLSICPERSVASDQRTLTLGVEDPAGASRDGNSRQLNRSKEGIVNDMTNSPANRDGRSFRISRRMVAFVALLLVPLVVTHAASAAPEDEVARDVRALRRGPERARRQGGGVTVAQFTEFALDHAGDAGVGIRPGSKTLYRAL